MWSLLELPGPHELGIRVRGEHWTPTGGLIESFNASLRSMEFLAEIKS